MTRVVVIAQVNETTKKASPIEALLDTGAMVSAIQPETLEALKQEMPGAKFNSVKINKTHVRGAFEQKGVVPNRLTQLTFEMREASDAPDTYTHEFYEITGLYVPIILGADFLGKNRIPVLCGREDPIVPKTARTRAKQHRMKNAKATANKRLHDRRQDNPIEQNAEALADKMLRDRQQNNPTEPEQKAETSEEFKRNLAELKNKQRPIRRIVGHGERVYAPY